MHPILHWGEKQETFLAACKFKHVIMSINSLVCTRLKSAQIFTATVQKDV